MWTSLLLTQIYPGGNIIISFIRQKSTASQIMPAQDHTETLPVKLCNDYLSSEKAQSGTTISFGYHIFAVSFAFTLKRNSGIFLPLFDMGTIL